MKLSPIPRTISLLLATALLMPSLFPVPVEAQQERQGSAFERMDTDGDGFVSEAELDAFRAERMAQRAEEGRPMRNAGNAPTLADMDTNQDGLLSPDEWESMRQDRMARKEGSAKGMGQHRGPRASFDEVDLDGDGCISREEFDAHHQARGKGSP